VIGSVIYKGENEAIKKGETLVTWEQHAVPVITEREGIIDFRDMIPGITLGKSGEKGSDQMIVLEHKEDLHPQIVVLAPKTKEVLASYSIPAGAFLSVKKGEHVDAGVTLAKTPRKVSKAKDITGGLPRVAELFEARKPKDHAEIAKIDGAVSIGGMVRGKRKVIVRDDESGEEEEHLVPRGKHIIVFDGDRVKKGDQLTEGPVVPHEILEILGPHELQEHLVNEVQEVYRLQGVEINDKHIEIIIRQMLRKVKITDPGDTEFLWGDQVERIEFEEANRVIVDQGGKPAEAEPVLLGITKASLETDSFISAASFQDTTRVLTEAATLGRVDRLRGFKENVIMGHLIPAGTGFPTHRDVQVVGSIDHDEPSEEDVEEAVEA
jgi:DNA-directed RNA polymerase subunit beta'